MINMTSDETQNQILHTCATEVTFPLTEKDLEFVNQLHAEVYALTIAPFGLAANQIATDINYIPKMFIAMFDFEEKEDGSKDTDKPVFQLFINPKIVLSGKSFKHPEGCLSVSKKIKKVRRHKNVTITYQDVNGNEYTTKIFGDAVFLSYIIQHEMDHLNGRIITDK